MTELAIDEPDATIVTDFAYDQTNTEQKSWKFCNDVTVPRSEVVFMSQMILIFILLTFCIYKLSWTRNVSLVFNIVWFSWVRATKPKDMNKITDTSTRLFMAVVGPSGSGKTELIFKLLTGRSFYPKFERVLFFYKDIQPVVMDELNGRRIHIEFVKFDGFDRLRNIENILLVFDDSCEEIYNDKEFVKLATAGRHRGLDVIYVKHNLFQQSRWSRTIDLNTSHIILFKSPRDIQQLDHLGRQLNAPKFLRQSYELATKDSFGHLLIDLDPRTSDCLRYCSNIIPPGPSIFYLPLDKAEVTPITNEREKIIYSATHGTVEPNSTTRLH